MPHHHIRCQFTFYKVSRLFIGNDYTPLTFRWVCLAACSHGSVGESLDMCDEAVQWRKEFFVSFDSMFQSRVLKDFFAKINI